MFVRKVLAVLAIVAAGGVATATPAGAVHVPDGQAVLVGGAKVTASDPVVTAYDDFEWSGPRRLR